MSLFNLTVLLQKLNHWGDLQITLRGYFRKKIISDLDLLLLGRKLTGENAYLSTWSSLIIPWALHCTDMGTGEKCHQVLAWGKVSVLGNRSHLCVLWGPAVFGWEPCCWSYREKSSPWCCWVVVEPSSSSKGFSSSKCLWVPPAALWGNSRWISLRWKVSYSQNRGTETRFISIIVQILALVEGTDYPGVSLWLCWEGWGRKLLLEREKSQIPTAFEPPDCGICLGLSFFQALHSQDFFCYQDEEGDRKSVV